MTLLSTGKLQWPNHTIISKETRIWLGIEDVGCKGITSDKAKSVLGGVRTFANLSAQEQWLSMHQCIDVACPIHRSDNYSKSPSPVNNVQGCAVPNIHEHSYDNVTKFTPHIEYSKCRRKLFGKGNHDKGTTGSAIHRGNQQTSEYGSPAVSRDADRADQLMVVKSNNGLHSLPYNYDEHGSLEEFAIHEHADHAYEEHNAECSVLTEEFSHVFRPRFMCTWLHDHASVDKYPLYKLSVVCANTVPTKREEFGVFSTLVTDDIWTSHKYIGETDTESLDHDETLNSSCKKSKSLESCVKETPVSVLKDIIDVDISDIKKKYSFLFDPKFIFRTTNSVKHSGVQSCYTSHGNEDSQHRETVSNVVPDCSVNNHVNGYNYNMEYINNPNYVPLGLTKRLHQIHTNDSHGLCNENLLPYPVTAHQILSYPDEVMANFSSSLSDPRLHRTQKETSSLNEAALLHRSLYSSPDTCRQDEIQVLTEHPKYKQCCGYRSDERPYSMMPRATLDSDITESYAHNEQTLWTPRYMELKEPSSHGSPLVAGLPLTSPNPWEIATTLEQNYHGDVENVDVFPLIERSNSSQSPLVKKNFIKSYPYEQQCSQSVYMTDRRSSNTDHGVAPKVNSTRCPRYSKRQYESPRASKSRSNSSKRKSSSHRDRGRKTRLTVLDDDFSRAKRNKSRSRSRSSRRSRRDGNEKDVLHGLRTPLSKTAKTKYGEDPYMHNPIPRYLMTDINANDIPISYGSETDYYYNKSIVPPHNVSRSSSYDIDLAPSCGTHNSTNRRLNSSSRDRSLRTGSRSQESMSGVSSFRKNDRLESARDKHFTTDNNSKINISEEYLRDRQKRSEHQNRHERLSKSNIRCRPRSRSSSTNDRRLKKHVLTNTKSRPRSFAKHTEYKYGLNYDSQSSRNESSQKNKDSLKSALHRRKDDYRARR